MGIPAQLQDDALGGKRGGRQGEQGNEDHGEGPAPPGSGGRWTVRPGRPRHRFHR